MYNKDIRKLCSLFHVIVGLYLFQAFRCDFQCNRTIWKYNFHND